MAGAEARDKIIQLAPELALTRRQISEALGAAVKDGVSFLPGLVITTRPREGDGALVYTVDLASDVAADEAEVAFGLNHLCAPKFEEMSAAESYDFCAQAIIDRVREIHRDGETDYFVVLTGGQRLRMSKAGWKNLIAANKTS